MSVGLRAAAIALAGGFALIGCFGAGFLQYDDTAHVTSPEYANAQSNWDFFVPQVGASYLPVTFLSYKADRWLHAGWAEKLYGSWAPGVRLDTLIVHALAALILWRFLARLRFSETRSFFIAMLFACHPLACETLCWASERKNAFAALFGFAALWTQSLAIRAAAGPPGTRPALTAARWPLMCVLYTLALMGKASALGLLPIFVALECLILFPSLQDRFWGKRGDLDDSRSELTAAPSRLSSYLGLAAMLAVAGVFLRIGLKTQSGDLVPPPGGTVITALLTDLDIFSRYVFNLVCPIRLSAMYYVEPILSVSDARFWLYGAALAGSVGATIYLARNRWVAAFGWFWFFAALGTNANVIAIVHWMQDRYLYLSTPGFLIAASECAAGLSDRFITERSKRSAALGFGAALCVACMAMSASRGYLWASTFKLGWDATQKQPRSFFAHYTLGCALNPAYDGTPPTAPEYALRLSAWRREFEIALTQCPDADLFNFKQWVACELGKDAYSQGDAAKAEHLFVIGATQTPLSADYAQAHSISLAYLCMLDLYFKRDPELALEKAKESVRLQHGDEGQLALANAYVACAQRNVHAKDALLNEARKALAEIPKQSPLRADADALLKVM